ncbi:MAG: hypothetical protein V2J89_14125 [Halieaceae bacterium]|nr:hypothetical protein [Halieaceae bacterium]
MTLASLFSISVFYFVNTFYFNAVYAMGNELGLDSTHPYFAFIETQRALLLRIYVLLSAVSFTLLMVFGLFISHRIAGPIYRVEKYMQSIADGERELEPVRLRRGDFFPEIENIVNASIKRLRDERKANGFGEPKDKP